MNTPMPILVLGVLAFVVVAGLVGLIVFIKYFNLWLQAFVTRARVSLLSLIAMSFRKVIARAIIVSKIMAVQAGLPPITPQALEAHYLAGGNVR
ncbi:MAG: flotillin-like FloA family protein, partial [Planctomycetaceae bacterium]